jgi:capsule polysaccharide export protein KpsE/RkpR
MDETQNDLEQETQMLRALSTTEDLAAKKARIYSRLLTEQTLAENMEALAIRHEERAKTLLGLKS